MDKIDAFWDDEDLIKDVLQSFSVIFDVEILSKNWQADHATNKGAIIY